MTARALQYAVRFEKTDPPSTVDICRAVALATIALLDDERAAPAGPWHEAVQAWSGGRIRKIVRRARGAAWRRVQELPGITVERDGVEVRAFVPGPVDEIDQALAKLQITSPALDDVDPTSTAPTGPGLCIAVTPAAPLSWGKQAAQCAHAAQRAWEAAPAPLRRHWSGQGRPLHVFHPEPSLWDRLQAGEPAVTIRDAGFTEVAPGTVTALAWWVGQPDGRKADPGDQAGTLTPRKRWRAWAIWAR